ncbi:hypothetical protein PBY51_016394 [Eleginops maclovinus]|uniref:Uncharacterized protein n=1 Tax=Eleginops maclovinus TaxID=56733 RepID=A0AAN7XSS3_ELEMC|nr:hypothetical protein PBY51_016394 [Eleginops maclovinus]
MTKGIKLRRYMFMCDPSQPGAEQGPEVCKSNRKTAARRVDGAGRISNALHREARGSECVANQSDSGG